MRMVDYESLADWNKIASAVPCPIGEGCGASVGQMCVERLATPKSRADFHSVRKMAAISVYQTGVREASDGPRPFGEEAVKTEQTTSTPAWEKSEQPAVWGQPEVKPEPASTDSVWK